MNHSLSPQLPEPHHRLIIQGRFGALQFDFQASFAAPWTVLFGPSGCGKSTLLRALCGLEAGLHVDLQRFHQQAWNQLSAGPHALAPERRSIAYAPQHAALFPHLTVLENIAFARTVRGRGQISVPPLRELLVLFDLEPLANRRPHHLSGGERGRVSLARAFAVPHARLMLLDEPFAGVDRSLRDALLPRMRTWLANHRIPVLSVTHDVDEPLLLQAEVLRLDNGRNAAQGAAASVLAPEIQRTLSLLHASQTP